ncbi:phospholipase A, partial [Neisseria dumasiana]
NNESGILSLREHNPMYILPAWYNSSPNYKPHSSTRGETNAEKFTEQKRMETKMQISFKTKIMEDLFKTRADVWFGYTQKSDWQVWSQGRKSAPFRNSDYMPELLITQPVKADLPFGGKLRVLGAGVTH